MTTIMLPTGQEAEFPNEMSLDDIKQVLRKKFPPPDQSKENYKKIDNFSYFTGINRTPIDTIRDAAYGAITGLGKGGQFIASKLTGGKAPQVDIDEIFYPIASKNKSVGGEIAKGIGEYAPYGIAGGSALLGQVAAGAGYGAATAKKDQDNLFGIAPKGEAGAALTGGLINALTHGAFKGIEALRPSRLLRGELTEKELKSNLSAAGDTETNLGDVIGSPFLKRQYENVLSKLPFSGANEKLQSTGRSVSERGKSILNDLIGDHQPENITDQINEGLKTFFKKNEGEKNNLYTQFNKIADENNLTPSFNNFSEALKKNKSALENISLLKSDPLSEALFDKIANETGALTKQFRKEKTEMVSVPYREIETDQLTGKKNEITKIKKIPQKVVDYEYSTSLPNIDAGTGKRIDPFPSYGEANILKGALLKAAGLAKESPEPSQRALSNVYERLGSALKKDIRESASETKNSALINAYNKAEENYSKNFSPLLDKLLYKFINGKADSDTILQSFLKTSRLSDRSKLLSKIANTIEPAQEGKQGNLLASAYFSPSFDKSGNFNPTKLKTLIESLGKNQFKVLIPDPVMRKRMLDYTKLHNMNTKSINMMFNPATGQQNLDIIPALLAHGGSSVIGGALGGVPGTLLGLAAPGLLARPIVKAITNPKTRSNFVKAMTENKRWDKNIPAAIQGGIFGLQYPNE
jgi:hypothetical protein